MMFKCIIFAELYGWSDAQTEEHVAENITVRIALGLEYSMDTPDRTTIWNFREQLIRHGLVEEFFSLYGDQLRRKGFLKGTEKIMDSTFIDVPRQRNTPSENEAIKKGEEPESFKTKTRQQRAHKDTSARWTKKHNEVHYGQKDHTLVDSRSKLIEKFIVTDASVHDSQGALSLIEGLTSGTVIYGDSAYRSRELYENYIAKGLKPDINERGYRGTPLTEKQRSENRRRSRTRSRVEHVYASMTNSRGGLLMIRTIGKERAKGKIGLINLAYNIRRAFQIETKLANLL